MNQKEINSIKENFLKGEIDIYDLYHVLKYVYLKVENSFGKVVGYSKKVDEDGNRFLIVALHSHVPEDWDYIEEDDRIYSIDDTRITTNYYNCPAYYYISAREIVAREFTKEEARNLLAGTKFYINDHYDEICYVLHDCLGFSLDNIYSEYDSSEPMYMSIDKELNIYRDDYDDYFYNSNTFTPISYNEILKLNIEQNNGLKCTSNTSIASGEICLFRDKKLDYWKPGIFFDMYKGSFMSCDGVTWNMCIPYKGNEKLLLENG